jgi:hypothetical protein
VSAKTYSGKPVALILGALFVGAAIFKWWPSDERAIRRQLDALADTLTMPSTDSELARVTRLAELPHYFAPDVRIRFGSQSIVSREVLMGLAQRWTPPPGGIFVGLVDTTIDVGDHDAAEVSLTVNLSSHDARTGEAIVDTREAKVGFVKLDGDWVITSVESRETP